MDFNATVIYTTGAPGTGKTYSRGSRYIIDHWIPEEKGVHYSNFPLRLDVIEDKFPAAVGRVKVIPEAELLSWIRGMNDDENAPGPWSYFDPNTLNGAHFAIDEAHLYLPKSGPGCQKNAKRWGDWLREIRHKQCAVEFLTQDPGQVHACVNMLAAVRIQLVNSEDRRDPLFGILLGDWYEVKAYFNGRYDAMIWQIEERRELEKWKRGETQKFYLKKEYFDYYNSYSGSIKDKKSEVDPDQAAPEKVRKLRQFEKKSALGFWLWFLRHNGNAFRLLSRFVLAAALFWVCFLGGAPLIIAKFLSFAKEHAAASKSVKKAEPVKEPEAGNVPVPPRVSRAAPVAPPPEPPQALSNAPAPVSVRSETLAHKTLESPPSPEVQQALVPRVSLVSSDFAALDDGQLVLVGDSVGSWRVLVIEFERRRVVFEGENNARLIVPVGGPVGDRLRKEPAEGSGGIVETVRGSLPRVEPTPAATAPAAQQPPKRAARTDSKPQRQGNAPR